MGGVHIKMTCVLCGALVFLHAENTFIHTKTSDTMARPVKTGLDYFPLPVDFFDDIRICAVAVEYGAKGQLAAVMLLVHLYKTGYYLKWDNVARVRLLKDMPGVTPTELDSIVRCLVEWDFFDKNLFEQEHVLTGREIQRQNGGGTTPHKCRSCSQKPTKSRQKGGNVPSRTKEATGETCTPKRGFRQQERRFSKQAVRKSMIIE